MKYYRHSSNAIIFAWCTAALVVASSAEGAIIRLRPKATVHSSIVVLGDVADIFDRNPEVTIALQRATLVPAPAAGDEKKIDFSMIRSRLQTQGFSLADLEFSGSSSVAVKSAPNPGDVRSRDRKSRRRSGLPASSWQVTRSKRLLSQAILSYLQTAELGDVDVEVKLNAGLAAAVVSGQAAGYEIRGGHPPWDAWQTMTVRFIDRDERLQSIPVQFRAVSRPLIPVAQRPLPAGHVLSRQDIAFRRAESAARSYPTIDELIGRETRRAIRQGQVIAADVVRQVPLVRRGDVVTAIAQIGGIQVKRQLYARSDGALGERVTLATLDRREQIEATVTAYHEATVTPSGSLPPTRAANNTAPARTVPKTWPINTPQQPRAAMQYDPSYLNRRYR